MRNSWDFRQGMGGEGASFLSFLSADSAAQVLLDRSKLFGSLTVFLIFFHIHFLETKAPKRLPVRRLVWAFVVRMYQRRISRDKVPRSLIILN